MNSKRTILRLAVLLLAFTLSAVTAGARTVRDTLTVLPDRDSNLELMTSKGWEWEIGAGLNFGGAAPLGMPRQVRKIHKYVPEFNGSLEGRVTKWWGKSRRWGTTLGLRFENKAMTVDADVKSYHTEIIREGDRVSGYWTGFVDIKYSSTFFTIPLMVSYRINPRWKVRAGAYYSLRTNGEFSGYVKDGYLRSGVPTGEKIVYTDGQRAAYDFDSDLRRSMWGAEVGGSWLAYRHFSVNANLTYGFNNIFRSNFTTVENTLHPLFVNVGFGYSF